MTKNQTPDEQIHDDAEAALADQTPTRRRFAIDETPDGDLVVLSKGERSAMTKLIATCNTIRKRATGQTKDIALKLLPLLEELSNAYRVHEYTIAKPK